MENWRYIMPQENNMSEMTSEVSQGIGMNLPIFGDVEQSLDYMEVQKIQHYLRTELKVGIEFEKDGRYHEGIDRELGVVGDYNHVGRLGIARSVRDGTIAGREWLYSSVNESYWAMLSKVKEIHEIFKNHGMHSSTSCGMHMHIMTMQKWDIPQVVMKNIWQLFRAFSPGLAYMSKTNSRNHQKMNGASWTTMLSRTPLHKDMKELQRNMSGRYHAVNLGSVGYWNADYHGNRDNQQYRGDNLDGMHFEVRFPDASDVPSQIVAQSFLYRAIVDKAVQLSEYGVIDITSMIEDWNEHKAMVNVVSSGANVSDIVKTYCQESAKALLKFVHGNIKAIDGASEDVLYALSDKNVQERSAEYGGRWYTIAGKVERQIGAKAPRDSEKAKSVRRLIVLGAIEADSPKEWKKIAESTLGFSITRNILHNSLNAEWDGKAGTYVLA